MIVLIGLFLLGSILLIFVLNSKEEDNTSSIEEYYHWEEEVMRIIDYADGKPDRQVIAKYKSNKTFINVYDNDVCIGYDASLVHYAPRKDLKKAIEILRNGIEEIENREIVDLESYATEIDGVYSLDMDTSMNYIHSLLKQGYEIVRSVESVTYCEVYLRDERGLIRYLFSEDTLIISREYSDSLPDVTKYFNLVRSELEV